jgi:hypothetical protein
MFSDPTAFQWNHKSEILQHTGREMTIVLETGESPDLKATITWLLQSTKRRGCTSEQPSHQPDPIQFYATSRKPGSPPGGGRYVIPIRPGSGKGRRA